ncbi:MAG: neocarzinostatin apoprotein domain-containing protein, partial [Acidimicrobiales bacterium]
MGLAALLVTSGSVLLGTTISGAATAAPATITVTPSTGLKNAQSLTVTGSGFAKNSIGNLLECNNDPTQPTVALPSPVSASLSVSCSAVSGEAIVLTNGKGDISATYVVVQGTVGPPCGTSISIIQTCPTTDSVGKSPAADAALYPCPPTAAQQAIGDVCTLTYGDEANDSASSNLLFGTETPPGSTTTTTTG